jgi:hypothetical protein
VLAAGPSQILGPDFDTGRHEIVDKVPDLWPGWFWKIDLLGVTVKTDITGHRSYAENHF